MPIETMVSDPRKRRRLVRRSYPSSPSWSGWAQSRQPTPSVQRASADLRALPTFTPSRSSPLAAVRDSGRELRSAVADEIRPRPPKPDQSALRRLLEGGVVGLVSPSASASARRLIYGSEDPSPVEVGLMAAPGAAAGAYRAAKAVAPAARAASSLSEKASDAARRAAIFRETEGGGSTLQTLNLAGYRGSHALVNRSLYGPRSSWFITRPDRLPRRGGSPRLDRAIDAVYDAGRATMRRTEPFRMNLREANRGWLRATEAGKVVGIPTAVYLREPALTNDAEELRRRRRGSGLPGYVNLFDRVFE